MIRPEEISKKRMTHAVDDVLGVLAQNIDVKFTASVVLHLCEKYYLDVRERVIVNTSRRSHVLEA